MRYGAALSAIFHVGILILAIVGLPSLLNSKRPEIVAVAVDIVTPEMLEKQAALPPKPEPPKPDPKPEPKKAEPPKPEPPKTAAPTPPPPPKPVPKAPEPAATPEPPPEPVAKPEPLPEPKPKAKKPEPPKPKVVKPAPPPPEKQVAAKSPPPAKTPAPQPKRKPKPPQDEFQSLLKNLAKEKERQEKKRPAPAAQAARQADPSPKISPLQARMMAASLSQAVMQQVTPCWSIPAGAKDAANMSVAIRIRLNPDGALGAQPRIEDTARIGSDPFFRAVAESALRALRNPRCMPLKLPYDQYEMWKDITFVFDPKEALGQ